jgi:pimeloyl-ACP methyl ester carboxylesterase
MTTVLFIHGTGVRLKGFALTRAMIERGLKKELEGRPETTRLHSEIDVDGCYWGGIGAEFHAGRASFYFDPRSTKPAKQPADDEELGVEPVSEEDEELAFWARLIDDPLYEIRFRELDPPPKGDTVGKPIRDRMLALSASPAVVTELQGNASLAKSFAGAVDAIIESDDFTDIFGEVYAADEENARMLARAVVAACVAIEASRGVTLSGERRDRLVAAVQTGFGAVPDHGLHEVTDRLTGLAKKTAAGSLFPFGPAWRIGRPGFISQFADILYYQAHGGGIRRALREQILKSEEPVVLLGHSLGGIIAFDLLTDSVKDEAMDRVKLLVTVGSQVPLFYELDVLAKLRYRKTPRAGFPSWPWVNVYDKRDMLAYGGAQLFPGRCTDVPVNTGAPFWPAHNAYWDTAKFYQELADALFASGL